MNPSDNLSVLLSLALVRGKLDKVVGIIINCVYICTVGSCQYSGIYDGKYLSVIFSFRRIDHFTFSII